MNFHHITPPTILKTSCEDSKAIHSPDVTIPHLAFFSRSVESNLSTPGNLVIPPNSFPLAAIAVSNALTCAIKSSSLKSAPPFWNRLTLSLVLTPYKFKFILKIVSVLK